MKFKEYFLKEQIESDLDLLTKIGTDDNLGIAEELLDFYNSKDFDEKIIKKEISLTVGSPPDRAWDPDVKLDFPSLNKIIDQFDENLIITHAGKIKKIRTPEGVRIGVWNSVESLVGKAGKIGKDVYKILMMFELIRENPEKLNIVSKTPPGISYELMQIKAISEELENLGIKRPIRLFINKEDTGIDFNGVVKREDVGKADMALTSNGKEVFWISYKHGDYLDKEGKPRQIPTFQQWGSMKTIYYKHYSREFKDFERAMKKVIDHFLQKACDKLPIGNEFTREEFIEREDLMKIYGRKLKNVEKPKLGGEVEKIYVFPQGQSPFFENFLKMRDKNMLNLALKSVYGIDFGEGKGFGPENVNILLQANEQIKLGPILDETGGILGYEIIIPPTGHLIKNPDLPDMDLNGPYIPCLYLRFTKAEYFRFGKNVVFGARTLIYPLGKVRERKGSIEI